LSRRVEPSMSEKRKVTVPLGSSGTTESLPQQNGLG
jgi:hypothetical protein